MSRSPRSRAKVVALLLVTLAGSAGCSGPYRGSKTLGAIGVGILASSAAMWAVGERTDRNSLARAGAAGSAVGAAVALGAGGWLAGSAACNVDPDCPEDELCREIPAPPGREPYRQCTPR